MDDPKITFDFSDIFIEQDEDEDIDATVEPVTIDATTDKITFDFSDILDTPDYEDISTARQLGYGYRQEPHILGSLYRGAEAVVRSIGSDKTITESFKEVEGERQEDILVDYPEFKDLKEQDEPAAVMAGRVTSSFTDLASWVFPWSKVGVAGKAGYLAAGATLSGSETALREYALYGEVDSTNVAISAVLGGTVAVGGEIVQKGLGNFIANRKSKGQATEAMEEIVADLSDPNKVLPSVIILDDEPLKPMNEVVRAWQQNMNEATRQTQKKIRESEGEIFLTSESPQIDFVKAYKRTMAGKRQSMAVELTTEETSSLAASTSKIVKEAPIKEEDLVNTTFIASASKEISVLEEKLEGLLIAQKKAKSGKDPEISKNIDTEISKVSDTIKTNRAKLSENVIRLSQQRTETSVDVLEDMAATGNLTSSIIQKVLYETARPLGFGAAGGVTGLATMDEDDGWGYILSTVGTGIALGVAQKRIQRSTAFTDIDKATGEMAIQEAGNSWLGNAARHLKYVTGMSTAARMDAMGGWNKVIGNRLFSTLGSNVESVEARTARLQADYLAELFEITGAPAQRSWSTRLTRITDLDYDIIDAKNLAINTVAGEVMRGYVKIGDLNAGYRGLRDNLTALDAEDIVELKKMVPLLEQLRDKTALRMEEVGIKFKKIENYGLHQVWDRAGIDDNYAEFTTNLTEALIIQETNRLKKAGKNITGDDIVAVKEKASIMADKISGNYINKNKSGYTGSSDTPIFDYNPETREYKFRTASNAFEKQRMLTDVEATKFMYEKGYLNLHAGESLSSSGTNAIKVSEFAEAFGADGEIFNLALKQVRGSFSKAMADNPNNKKLLTTQLKQYEEQMTGAVEAYWGGYGHRYSSDVDVVTKAFTTLANVTYLTTVSIANLGDLVQPFINTSYGAAFKTLAQRVGKDKLKFSEMSSFKYDKAYERDLASFMRKSSTGSASRRLDNINDFYFFSVGLSKVTEVSRNFAYDVGVNRAFILAKKKKLNKNEVKELSEMKLTRSELKQIGSFETVEKAFENDASIGSLLDKAARSVADRDAIIPSVGNRLLFTQTNNTAVRSVGQFMSWAQAKTTQTNTLLGRVENGDAKLALRILAAAPVYGAFLELKRTLNPYHIEDEGDKKDSTLSTLNFIGDSMKLSGSYNNAILDKAMNTLKSVVTYDKGIGESLIPSLGLLFGAIKGGADVALDVGEGEFLKALKRTAVALPVVSQISSGTEKITGTPLIEVEPKKTKQRGIYNKGGEVLNVPNVPTEPDQRIDKMTGRPYDQQAGPAFVDNEDPLQRLGFVKGGVIMEDPLKRLGFGK